MQRVWHIVLLVAFAAGCSLLTAWQKPGKKESYAVIAGTVFREPGFAVAGADVSLEPNPEAKTSLKVKKMKGVSDRRGEFAFRVPPAAMRYNLIIRAEGFSPETRTVVISGEERQDVFVTLKDAKEAKP